MASGPEQLRDWMGRRGFNQPETALYLGFDIPYISQILSGARNPGLPRAVAIERKTGIPVEAWSDMERKTSLPAAAIPSDDVDESESQASGSTGKRRLANR